MADQKYYDHIFHFLDTVGDGSGDDNANGNYSVTEGILKIQPGAGEIYEIHRLIISIEDSNNMQAEVYGDLGVALTNGVAVRVRNDLGVLRALTNGNSVKSNAGWGALCYDVDLKEWGAGNELLVARMTFSKSGQPLLLRGDENERLEVVLNDNFTGLIKHQFMAQGLDITTLRDQLAR